MKRWRSRGRSTLAYARVRARRVVQVARLLPLAGPAAPVALALNVALGALPLLFICGTGLSIGMVVSPTGAVVARESLSLVSAAGMALTALAAYNALTPFQAVLGELIARRVDGGCARRLMGASVSLASLTLLERPDVAARLADARRGLGERSTTPGAAAAGLVALVARYTQLLGALTLVAATAGASTAASLGVSALVARFSNRGALSRWARMVKRTMRQRQRMRYVLDAGSDTHVAKDFRVFGILPWWSERAAAEVDRYLRPLWSRRRQVYFRPFLVFAGLQLLSVTVAFLMFGRATAEPLSVTALAIGIQATLIPIRFGVFFPESDVQMEFGMGAHDSIEELEGRLAIDAPPRPAPSRAAAGLPVHVISFEDVSFSYPGSDRAVLDGFNLELEARTSTAIVGLNGAGKTTLIKLLARLYEPTRGDIKVDGVSLRGLDLRTWHRRLAVIFQDYQRYEVDAAANVALGAPERMGDADLLRWAIDRAGAREIIDALPRGEQTILSSRYIGGVDLSGGQWQRIALARALFAVGAGASILALDEPTAQLDVRAEVAFFDRFLELTRGLTTLVISHRFSTVRRADRIVVIADGRVVEDGCHDELMRHGGRYADLFRLQARRFSDSPIAPAVATS